MDFLFSVAVSKSYENEARKPSEESGKGDKSTLSDSPIR
jgi:hypothetical protein